MTSQCKEKTCNRAAFARGFCDWHLATMPASNVPADEALKLINRKLRGGRSVHRLSQLAGVSGATIQNYLDGKRNYMMLHIYKSIEAVDELPENYNHPILIRRRLEALRAVGLTYSAIYREGGLTRVMQRKIMNEPGVFIQYDVAKKIRDLYEKHKYDSVENTPAYIKNEHNAPPAAWDDIDDLQARPKGQPTRLEGERIKVTSLNQSRARLLVDVYGRDTVAKWLKCTEERVQKIENATIHDFLAIESNRLRFRWNKFVSEQQELRGA